MGFNNQIRRLLNRCGYDLRRLAPGASPARTSMAESYALMRRMGFAPATVIDVGVATGTPELYDSFPQAALLLIEPIQRFERDLAAILSRRRGTYIMAAAGAMKGTAKFNLHEDHLSGSSLYKEAMGAAADGREIMVPMVRMDDVIAEKGCVPPFLLKVDVQGAEMEVLAGAQGAIKDIEVIVLEVSLFEFMQGAPQLAEVITGMRQCGYAAWDIIHGWNRPLDGALGQVDIVFVREGGWFRRDHAYATPEQRRSAFGA